MKTVLAGVLIILALLPSLFAQVPPAPVDPLLETIASDLHNVRGLNYITAGSGSSYAMWLNYNATQVEIDLTSMNRIGCNAVRVWLCAEALTCLPPGVFIARFQDLLQRCLNHGIHVMPILFDDIGADPGTCPGVNFWYRSPDHQSLGDATWRTTKGDPYVNAVINAGDSFPNLLAWDVMNEPNFGLPATLPFLQHYSGFVRARSGKHITIGVSASHYNAFFAHWSEVTFLSYHPYGCFRQSVQGWTAEARRISALNGNKPILPTEFCSPGLMEEVRKGIEYCVAENVGFFLFQAMIGPPPHPFHYENGFFFTDGEVRDLDAVLSFQAHSASQGYLGQMPTPIVKSSTSPGYIAQTPIPVGFGLTGLFNELGHFSVPLTPANFNYHFTVIMRTGFSLAASFQLTPSEFAYGLSLYNAINFLADLNQNPVRDYNLLSFYLQLLDEFNRFHVLNLNLGG